MRFGAASFRQRARFCSQLGRCLPDVYFEQLTHGSRPIRGHSAPHGCRNSILESKGLTLMDSFLIPFTR